MFQPLSSIYFVGTKRIYRYYFEKLVDDPYNLTMKVFRVKLLNKSKSTLMFFFLL